jgi:hypothetical protein
VIFYLQAQGIGAWPIKARQGRYRQAATDCGLKAGIALVGASGRGEPPSARSFALPVTAKAFVPIDGTIAILQKNAKQFPTL